MKSAGTLHAEQRDVRAPSLFVCNNAATSSPPGDAVPSVSAAH